MQRRYPMAKYIHCRSHQLNLACVAATKSTPRLKRLFSCLNSLWRFFHLSPKRTRKFESVQEILESNSLSLVQPGDTRWSSNFRAVTAVCSNLLAIIVTLQDIHTAGDDLCSEAGGLLLAFQDTNMIELLFGVQVILRPLHMLSLQLQSSSLKLPEVPSKVSGTIQRLNEIKSDASTYTSDYTKFSERLRSQNINTIGQHDENLHETVIVSYIEKLVGLLDRRLSGDGIESISKAMRIFEPMTDSQKDSHFGEGDVCLIAEAFSLPTVEVLQEWQVFRNYLKTCDPNLTATDTLTKLASGMDLALGFPMLSDIAMRVMCAPLGTASVERSFSTMNRVTTRLRQRLLPRHIRDAMLVSIEGSKVDNFIPIVKLWHSSKPRRLPIPA